MEKQIVLTDLAALIPRYSKGSNVTELINTSGEKRIINNSLPYVLRDIAHSYNLSLTALKNSSRNIMQQKNLIPLCFCPGIVLFPIKTRQGGPKGDYCSGYLNYIDYKEVKTDPDKQDQSIIELTNGLFISCLWKQTTVLKRMQQAEFLLDNTLVHHTVPHTGDHSHAELKAHCFQLAENILNICIYLTKPPTHN